MSKFSNTIEYNIKTNLDASGLNKLQQQLNAVSESFSKMLKNNQLYSPAEYNADIQRISKIQKALAQSFNNNLNVLDVSSFTKNLNGLPLQDIQKTMSKTSEGAIAFNNILGTIGQMDTGFKSISSFADKIMNTFGNTVRWGITASIFQTIQNSLYRSVDYVKDLDTSLNNIQIVTDASAENMRNFSLKANEAAANLGSSTVAFTDAAQLYAQNGYSEEDYTKLAELTTKVANVTQQSTSEVSEQITSLMAGYKMSIDEAEDSLSGMAVVAAESASDLGELANAEQKVASAASTLGVSQDQLTAQLSTIISVTRQAPEQVGNSLKTIYARLGDLQMGETLDDGVSLGNVSSALEKVGVAVLDVNGDMRSMGDIIEDLMAKWQDLSAAQQQALAVKLAGKYQYNNLMTLMSNSDMYKEQKNTFNSSQGALDKQQGIYMESLQAKIQKLQTTWEGFVTELVDSNNFEGAIDGLSSLIKGATDLTDALGGMQPVLTLVSSLMLKTFSNNIGASISNMLDNRNRQSILQQNDQELLSMFGGQSLDGAAGQFLANTVNMRGYLSKEQAEQYSQELTRFVEIDNDVIRATSEYSQAQLKAGDVLSKQNSILSKYNLQLSEEGEFYGKNADKLNQLLASLDSAEEEYQRFSEAAGTVQILANNKQKSVEEKRKEVLGTLTGIVDTKELEDGESAYHDIYKQLQNVDITAEELSETIEKLHEQFTKTYTDWGQIAQELKNNNGSVATAEEALRQKGIAEEEIKRAEQWLEAKKAAQDKANEDGLRKKEQLRQQQLISNFTNLISVLGQLAFAWQSFQSLGSLWADDDMSTTEKMAKTLSSLVVVFPSIISSAAQLQQILKSMGVELKSAEGLSLIEIFKKIKAESKSTAQAISGVIDAVKSSFAGLKASITEVISTMGPFITAMLAIGTVTAIVSAHLQDEQNKIDNIKESANKASENLTSLQSAESNFQNLYGQYKAGKVSADELSSAAETLNGLIDNQSAKAQAAAGNWDEYAKSVKNAAAEQAAANASTIQANTWQAEKEFVEAPGIFGSAARKAQTAANSWGNDNLESVYNNNGSISAEGINGNHTFKFITGTSAEQRIHDLDAMGQAYKEAIEQAQKNLDSIQDVSSQEYKNAKKTLQDLQTDSQTLADFRAKTNDKEQAVKTAYSSQAANLLAQFQDNEQFKYTSGTVEDYRQKVKEQLKQAGYDVSEQVLDSYVEGMMNSGTDSGKALAAEKVKEDAEDKYNALNDDLKTIIDNANLSDDQRIKLLGQLDEKATAETINNQIKQIEQNSSLDTLQLKTSYADDLESVNNTQSSLSGLFDEFESDVDDYGFTDAEVAKKLQEHPEYMAYLTKVGDVWKLNKQALDDYNRSLEEQSAIVDDAMGGTSNFANYNDVLKSISSPDSHASDSDTFAAEGLDSFVTSNQDLNDKLANGEMGFTDYFDGISDALENSGALDALDKLNGKFDETTDSLEEVASVAANELADGLVQANKAFVKGDSTVGDYVEQLDKGLDAQKDLLNSLYDLTDADNGYVSAAEDADDATKAAADSYNDAVDAQKNLEQAAGFADVIQKNSELLSDYGDNLKDVFSNEDILSDDRMPQYISDLTNQFVAFANSSTDNMSIATSQIAEATGSSQDYIQSLLEQASSSDQTIAADAMSNLQNLTGGSLASIESLTGSAMQNTSSAITNASTAIGSVLSALGSAISSFDYTIKATPSISGGEFDIAKFVSSGGTQGISFPSLSLQISGSGGASISNLASALTNAGGYFTNAGNQQAAAAALDLESYYPSSSGGGSRGGVTSGRPVSGSGKGKSGSGGGGKGSGSSYTPKTKDKQEDEYDRYEKVNAHLDRLSKTLDKLADAQDRLTGKKLADNMAEQAAILEQQVKWQKEKLELQQQEASELQGKLAAYGVQFDSEGYISNYKEAYYAQLNKYNSAIDAYNADGTEAGQEAQDKIVEQAKKSYDDFKDLISEYDDLRNSTIEESLKDIEDYYDKIEDLRINAFKKSVEAVDDMKDMRETLIDFNAIFRSLAYNTDFDEPFNNMATNAEKLKQYWDMDKVAMNGYYDELIKNNKEAMSQSGVSNERKNWLISRNQMYENAKNNLGNGTLEAGGTGYLDMEMKNLNDIMEQINQFETTGTSSIFGENSADLYDVAKSIFESATSMVEDLKSEMDDLKSNIIDGIGNIGDAIDKQLDKFDNINDTLEHYADMIEMVSGDQAYDKLNAVYEAQIKNGRAELDTLKASIGVLEDLQKTFEEGSDQWNEVADQIADKQSQVLDKTKDIMDLMNQVYSNNVSKQLDNWLKDTPLGADLDWMSDQWELINRNEDQYLDKTNSAYNIQKLQAKYLDLLDQSDNLLTQQKITDQMNQQLNMLRSKNKLSQYDVDYANAQLEILQKTIALQDAQNNKSQMKLRRDTQGNYSYVYTANEGDVKNAQSDLLDAQNNAYNLSKDQIKQTQDDSLSALQDAKSMISDIWTNVNLTLEEKTDRTKTIIDSLKEYLAGTADQLSEAEQNIIQDFIGMCEMMTDENKSGLDDVYDQIINGNDKAFSQIDTRWGDAISQWLGNLDQFNQATDKTFESLVDNAKDYADKTQSLGEQVGLNFSDMTDAINAAKTATDDLAASTSGFIDKLEASSGTLKSYEKQLDEYKSRVLDLNNAMGEYQSKVNSLESSLQAEQRKNADLSDQLAASEAKYNAAYGNNGGSGGAGGAGGVSGSSDDVAYGIAQSIWTFGQQSGWGNNPTRSDKLNSGYGSDFAKKVQDIINQKVWSGSATDLVNYDSMSYSSYNLLGYDTGGYTGTWSETEGLDSDAKNGKLAILHQKELVLNETDTANILKAVEYVREMAQEMSSNGIMADLADRYNAWSTKVSEIQQSLAGQNGNIDQTVNVNAEFPNATSAEEIKTALNDLANAAIQYTGKRIGRYGLN